MKRRKIGTRPQLDARIMRDTRLPGARRFGYELVGRRGRVLYREDGLGKIVRDASGIAVVFGKYAPGRKQHIEALRLRYDGEPYVVGDSFRTFPITLGAKDSLNITFPIVRRTL